MGTEIRFRLGQKQSTKGLWTPDLTIELKAENEEIKVANKEIKIPGDAEDFQWAMEHHNKIIDELINANDYLIMKWQDMMKAKGRIILEDGSAEMEKLETVDAGTKTVKAKTKVED